MQWHGVNMAEGLKALPSTYRFTHNQTGQCCPSWCIDTPKPTSPDLDVASQGWDLLFQYHGRPSGIYAADEYLAGLEAVRGCGNRLRSHLFILMLFLSPGRKHVSWWYVSISHTFFQKELKLDWDERKPCSREVQLSFVRRT